MKPFLATVFSSLFTSLLVHQGSVDALSSTIGEKAIIIGGGPVGLATALTLADEPHCYDVSVFEAAAPEEYDPTKAYLYNVNFRGQRFTRRYASLQKRLCQEGIPSVGVSCTSAFIRKWREVVKFH